jgi:hypothetical protein
MALNVGYTLLGLASVPSYYERVTAQTVKPYVVADREVISNGRVAREGLSWPPTSPRKGVERRL